MLVDSTGRRLAGFAQPSPPMATVVVDFAQLYFPSHCRASFITRAASMGADRSPSTLAASAGVDCRHCTAAPSAGADSSPSSAGAAAIPIHLPLLVRGGEAATDPKLLAEFPDIVCESKRSSPVSHDDVHHIVTTGLPITCKFCHLDGKKLVAAKAEFRKLEADGIIQLSM